MSAARHAAQVVLVGWDGADWEIVRPLVQAGQMPQMARLISEGATGPLRSLPPYLSPMLWNSIATGKRPHKHGIHGFTEVNPATRQVQPVSSSSRRCKALWNILSENAIPSHVVGWFASHPAESVHGVCVSEAMNHPPSAPGAVWPAPLGAVWPVDRLEEFAALRVRPEEIDSRILDLLVPRWREVDQAQDQHLSQLLLRLAELYSTHNMAVALARSEAPGFLAVYYHFLDWISHDFMLFHPPRLDGVDEDLFNIYRDTVTNAYRLQDLLLTDLLHAAGPDTTLVLASDHGFYSDARRPRRVPRVVAGIAAWHRPHGILALGGPGVRPGEPVRGASLLDLAPTVLALFGLPHGEDMDGRPLWSVLDVPTGTGPVPSWDNRSGRLEFARPNHSLVADNADFLLRQFVELGYVQMPKGEDPVAFTTRLNGWNLGVALLDAGELEEALPHLEEAWFHDPEQGHMAFQLALCQQALGLAAESDRTMETLRDAGPDHAMANFVLGQWHAAANRPAEALACYERARAANPHLGDLDVQRGFALLSLQRWSDARDAFTMARLRDPDSALARLGLARSSLRDGDHQAALEQAREALALDDSLAFAHLTLAQAYDALGRLPDATQAYQEAFDRRPGLLKAQARLLALLPGSLEGLSRRLEVLQAGKAARKSTSEIGDRATVDRLRREAAERSQLRERDRAKRRACQAPVERFVPPGPPGSSGRTFVIVSGAPRSGTSLMMQMLARGGLEPLTDRQRGADQDNPEGYFEWEAIKDLPAQPRLIEQAQDRVLKVVTPLLPHLPAEHRYRVVFMRRPTREIARSQCKMLAHQGRAAPSETELADRLEEHIRHALEFLRCAPQVDLLVVDYPELVERPTDLVHRLVAFLGSDRLPRAAAMTAAVKPELYRNRERAHDPAPPAPDTAPTGT